MKSRDPATVLRRDVLVGAAASLVSCSTEVIFSPGDQPRETPPRETMGADGGPPSTEVVDAGPTCQAQPGRAVSLTYDDQTFTFSEITLRGVTDPSQGQWQRQSGKTALWEDVAGQTQATLTLQPRWQDVGARYRFNCGPAEGAAIELPMPLLQGLSPLDFGALGDGTTDDTAALNRILQAAAERRTGVDLKGKTYLIADLLRLLPGVTSVFNGSILEGAANTGLYLWSKEQGHPANCRNVVLANLTFPAPLVQTPAGIVGFNPSNVAIIGCRLEGTTRASGILIISGASAIDPTDGIVVRDTVIRHGVAGYDTPGHALEISCRLLLGPHPDVPTYWRANRRGPAGWAPLTNVYIGHNDFEGGYYGIAHSAVSRFVIEHNRVTNNVRNVSLQNSCTDGLIRSNDFSQSLSSSIHLAYGSANNRILDNTIVSDRAKGQALLNAYVGVSNNRFIGNTVEITGSGPKWHIYCGIHANGNVFERNRIKGSCAGAYVAFEAAWDSTNPHPPHYGTGIPEVDGFAAANSSDNQLIENIIEPTSAVEAICLADIDDQFGQWRLVNAVIRGNVVVGRLQEVPHRAIG